MTSGRRLLRIALVAVPCVVAFHAGPLSAPRSRGAALSSSSSSSKLGLSSQQQRERTVLRRPSNLAECLPKKKEKEALQLGARLLSHLNNNERKDLSEMPPLHCFLFGATESYQFIPLGFAVWYAQKRIRYEIRKRKARDVDENAAVKFGRELGQMLNLDDTAQLDKFGKIRTPNEWIDQLYTKYQKATFYRQKAELQTQGFTVLLRKDLNLDWIRQMKDYFRIVKTESPGLFMLDYAKQDLKRSIDGSKLIILAERVGVNPNPIAKIVVERSPMGKDSIDNYVDKFLTSSFDLIMQQQRDAAKDLRTFAYTVDEAEVQELGYDLEKAYATVADLNRKLALELHEGEMAEIADDLGDGDDGSGDSDEELEVAEHQIDDWIDGREVKKEEKAKGADNKWAFMDEEDLLDGDGDDPGGKAGLLEATCGECGYTLFVAPGKDNKFWSDDYVCLNCGAPKASFDVKQLPPAGATFDADGGLFDFGYAADDHQGGPAGPGDDLQDGDLEVTKTQVKQEKLG